MKHLFIMDPPASVKPWKDTTYYLMLAAAERGHQVAWCEQDALWLAHERLHATVEWLQVHADHDAPFTPLQSEAVEVQTMDAVWIRTDPPFDRRYFYTTLLLEYLPSSTRVLNRPAALRDWNEKLAALRFPQYTPATLVAREVERVLAFAREHRRVLLKPIDGFGGRGIAFYDDGDDVQVIREATHDGAHWIIVQENLSGAAAGDRRILLLNGEPLGGILRRNDDGSRIHNLDAGGEAHPLQLNDRDLEICAALKPWLVEHGVFFAGIDIIDGMLIEVNVTSPTGLQELSRFSGVKHHHGIIEALESA